MAETEAQAAAAAVESMFSIRSTDACSDLIRSAVVATKVADAIRSSSSDFRRSLQVLASASR